MHDATRVIRAGLHEAVQGAPFLPGPTFASAYHFAGEVETSPYTYGRYHNPTWTAFEQALSELEGGHALVFASGMAAVTAVLGVALHTSGGTEKSKVLVMPSDSYYTARMLADGFFASTGIEVRKAPTAGNALGAFLDGARLLWLETPANPGMDVCDLAELIAEAHQRGVLVAVDNTTATVLGQRPLELGADFSVASDTKSLTGHSDIMLGHVAVRDPVWTERLLAFRSQQGAIPGPMEVWLAHRSLATLDMRLERQCRNAQAIAQMLAERPEVRLVRYPGLPQDPAHAIASRQMKHYGPVMSFVLADKALADRFLAACRLVLTATSFGGICTTAERRARWGGDAIPEGFIRLSAGCEDTQDLLEDISQALDMCIF
ncbi:MAG TPA: cystathionine gamma-lyase [Ktedonobacteraceae bacterium]|nr:cystathionine gamma-lyase [Ktedonobacteraceae bacterium]